VPGTGPSIAGLSAIVWALIEAPEKGWTSPTILAAFAAGAAIIGAFIAWERHTDHPMLDVSVFRNLRFSAASISIACVFFALMGVMFCLTTYLQSVLGDSALQAGVKMLPIALGMILASKLGVGLTRRFGTKLSVASGLSLVAGALAMIAMFDTDTRGLQIAVALGTLGLGMGFAMSPATEAIMGALPRAKAGVGSAMNDVVREVGGTLGIAVLGSILSSGYGSAMADATAGLPHAAADAASDSVGAANEVGAQVGGRAGARLIETANGAFVDAMTTTATLAAATAVIGALIALAFPVQTGRPDDERERDRPSYRATAARLHDFSDEPNASESGEKAVNTVAPGDEFPGPPRSPSSTPTATIQQESRWPTTCSSEPCAPTTRRTARASHSCSCIPAAPTRAHSR
jgi:DHA2 family multidrug resistance protein-like MFS transporter